MGKLTKKDFEALASLISERANLPVYSRDIRLFIPELCDWLRTTNKDFNESAFLKACGVEE